MGDLINITSQGGLLVVSSREVARNFGKEHFNVVRDIENLIVNEPLKNEGLNYFIPSTFNHRGNEYKEYLLTRDGFSLLVMGFTGKKALEWKLKYIKAFNEMEEALKQISGLLSEEQKLQLAIFQAKTPEEAAMAAANLDRYRQLQLEEKQREIEHKNEVIKGITDDVDVYTKRAILNRVVRHKGANFKERWDELYRTFRETYSIDLKARCEGYNLKQTKKKDKLSVVKYAEKFGYIHDLYKVALKLYETDIKEILKHLEKIA